MSHGGGHAGHGHSGHGGHIPHLPHHGPLGALIYVVAALMIATSGFLAFQVGPTMWTEISLELHGHSLIERWNRQPWVVPTMGPVHIDPGY